jgi:hypothetical protein
VALFFPGHLLLDLFDFLYDTHVVLILSRGEQAEESGPGRDGGEGLLGDLTST